MFLPRVIDALPRLFVETSASYFTNGGGVGDGVGLIEVGFRVGALDGFTVGLSVGLMGLLVGALEGVVVGLIGLLDGETLGPFAGELVGLRVGD